MRRKIKKLKILPFISDFIAILLLKITSVFAQGVTLNIVYAPPSTMCCGRNQICIFFEEKLGCVGAKAVILAIILVPCILILGILIKIIKLFLKRKNLKNKFPKQKPKT